jgi:hypothetical protein
MQGASRYVRIAIAASVLGIVGCGRTENATTGAVASPPSRGKVWEILNSEERATVAGAIVAFVNGMHVMVVDGERVFAGMTELKATSGPGGATTITLPSGLTAIMLPTGNGIELQFSTGERAMLRERPEPG